MQLFHKRSIRRLFVLALIALMCITSVSGIAEAYAALVTADVMPVYQDPGCTTQIGYLPQYTAFSVGIENSGVAYICWNGRTGFVRSGSYAPVQGLGQAAVFNTNSRAYQAPSTSSRYVNVPAGFQVNLIATNGGCAMIECGGVIAYTLSAHLTLGQALPETPQEGVQQPAADEVVYAEFSARVTADVLYGYKAPSASGRPIGAIQKGTIVRVHAYNSDWALVDCNGAYAFCPRAGLEKYDAPVEQPPQDDTPAQDTGSGGEISTSDYLESDKYSNEEKIYIFLVREMGLSSAAACGILANIKCESSFRPTAYNSSGGSYGICQWTGGRKTRLQDFCSKNGYDYKTIRGQLYFLKYELENNYKKTLAYLQSVENSASGAYDAGYYYCYNFEVPANRSSVSVKRGNLAKDTYWPKYN